MKFKRKHRWLAFKLVFKDGANRIDLAEEGGRKDSYKDMFEYLDEGGCRYAGEIDEMR